jgi:Family of unknown function (DUF5691)
MSAWQELTKLALLGTEKVPLQLQLLPEPIQQQLASADPTDREALFLQAAALVRVYDRAGQKAQGLETLETPLAPDETQPFPPPQYIELLKRLLDEKNARPDLLCLFLEKMVAKNYVLTHDVLVDFLNTFTSGLIYEDHFDNAQKVLGTRGHWLAPQHKNWQKVVANKLDFDWSSLSGATLNNFLSTLRKTEPQRVFEFIQQNWEEATAKTREGFLNVLEHHTQPEELDFVQDIYDEILRGGNFKKQVNQDIRKIAAQILLRLPESNLFKSSVLGLKSYFSTKKQLLGLTSQSIFKLPKDEDGFFNNQNLAENLGFGIHTNSEFWGVTHWWLCFCEHLHPTAWEQIFETTDWHKIIKFLKGTEGVKHSAKDEALKKICHRLYFSHHRPAVLVFIQSENSNFLNSRMLNPLTINELEDLIVRIAPTEKTFTLTEILMHQKEFRPDWQWSRNFSLHILRGGILGRDIGHFAKSLLDLTIYLHPSLLDDLYQETRKDVSDYQEQHKMRQVVSPMIQIMEFKKEINYLN